MALRKSGYESLTEEPNEQKAEVKKNEHAINIHASDIKTAIDMYRSNKKSNQKNSPEIELLKNFFDEVKDKNSELSGEEISKLVKILLDTVPKENSKKTIIAFDAIKDKFPKFFLGRMKHLMANGWTFPANYFKRSDCALVTEAYLQVFYLPDVTVRKIMIKLVDKYPKKTDDFMKEYKKINKLPTNQIVSIMEKWSPKMSEALAMLESNKLEHPSYRQFILDHTENCLEIAKIMVDLKEARIIDVPGEIPGVLNFLWQNVKNINQELVKKIGEMKNLRTLNFESLKAVFKPNSKAAASLNLFKPADVKEEPELNLIATHFSNG